MMRGLFAVGRGRVTLFVALSVVLGALISADAFVLQWLITTVQSRRWDDFAACAVAACVVLVAQGLVYWWRQTYAERLAYVMMDQLRARLFDRVARTPLPRVKDLPADGLFSRFTAQLEQVKANLIDVLLYGVALVAQVAFAIASIMAINPVLGACALALCVPMALVPVLSKRRVESARNALVTAQNDLNGELGDLLRGVADWRLMHREPQVRARLARRGASWLRAARRDAGVQMGVDATTNALSHILVFGIWLIGGLLIMRGGMTVAQVVALYALIGNISVPLFQMSGLVAQYHAGRETLRQLDESIDGVPDRSGGFVLLPCCVPWNCGLDAGPDDGAIRYRDVRLHHTGRPFSVTLSRTGRYLVTGASGSGKSSLVRALVGLDDDYDGLILIGDADVRYPGSVRQARIGYLSQQSHVFRGSIRENVRLFDDSVDDATVLTALRCAQLDEWVAGRGLDWQVDDSLNRLSGGERQRLLLARVLAQGYDFCVLDEFDAGLDEATAARIDQVVLASFAGFIAITHRRGTLLAAHATATLRMAGNTLVAVIGAEAEAEGGPEAGPEAEG